MKALKTITGIMLLPMAFAVGKAFYEAVTGISIFSGALHIMERGFLTYLIIHVMVLRPAYIYVLGHEFVHALACWVCGGKVLEFNVTPRGGACVTNKTNVFIELSPYFVPVYTLALGPVFWVLDLIGKNVSFVNEYFLFLVGLTLAFHFAMTSEVLRMEQPDIVKSGAIFSFVLIFVGNLIIVMALFSPIFDQLHFVGFLRDCVSGTKTTYIELYEAALTFGNTYRFW